VHHIPIARKKRNKKVDCISDGGYQRERAREEDDEEERFKLLARKRKKNVDIILDGVYKKEEKKEKKS